jgi:hypothetical protein
VPCASSHDAILLGVNDGSSTMLLLTIGQIVANAAIWFCAGALLTRIFGR